MAIYTTVHVVVMFVVCRLEVIKWILSPCVFPRSSRFRQRSHPPSSISHLGHQHILRDKLTH